jgi:hypothetical membrane protein
LKAVLGGMGLRMLVMLGALLMLIEVFHFSAAPLVVSLMGFYVLFLVLEVMFMQKKLSKKTEG